MNNHNAFLFENDGLKIETLKKCCTLAIFEIYLARPYPLVHFIYTSQFAPTYLKTELEKGPTGLSE